MLSSDYQCPGSDAPTNQDEQPICEPFVVYYSVTVTRKKIELVEPPFGLRLLLPFWCRRGGYWCTAGARKRKIGARVGLGRKNRCGSGFLPIYGSSQDPVGTQSGTNFCIFGHRFWPVGIQSGSSRAPMSGGSQTFLQCFCMFLGDFGCFPTGPNVVPKIRKLVPDWIPTGSWLDRDWPKAVPKNAKIGARLGPDWVPSGSRPGFFKKTPISLNLSTYFLKF